MIDTCLSFSSESTGLLLAADVSRASRRGGQSAVARSGVAVGGGWGVRGFARDDMPHHIQLKEL